MKIQALETTFLSDPNLSNFQDNLIKFSNQLTTIPFLNGRMLTVIDANNREVIDIPLSTAVTKIAHKLGKAPLGYIVTYQNANAVIYAATLPKANSDDFEFLNLYASANVVANIWIF